MRTHEFTLIFLALLALGTGLQLWLATRQIRHVRAHRDAVPAAFAGRVTLEAHRKAADYTVARTRFGCVGLLLSAAVLLAWTLGGGLEALDRSWRAAGWSTTVSGVAVIVSCLMIGGLLELPLAAYRQFGLEARFGFNRMTPGLFFADLAKGIALSLALGAPLAWLVLWLMHHAGGLWWLYAWGVWAGFNGLLVWVFPMLIAPLFNRFTPLEDDGLRARLEALLTRCGFRSSGVFVMDGSRRSGHGNAYFTGFGRAKRIVFLDTLLETLAPEHVEAVLAHELGHYRRHHIHKRLASHFALSLAGLAALGWLAGEPWFYAGLGVSQPSPHAALLLFMLAGGAFTVFLHPLAALVSRRHEFEADAFAAEQTDARALIDALLRLYRDNAATLTPDPLYSAFHDSHPPAPIRIAHLERLCRTPEVLPR